VSNPTGNALAAIGIKDQQTISFIGAGVRQGRNGLAVGCGDGSSNFLSQPLMAPTLLVELGFEAGRR
jgi:hypothetical protein